MMIFVWWLVLGYFPTSVGAVLAVAALSGPYSYRARHGAPGRRSAAPSTFRLSQLGLPHESPLAAELRAARVRLDAVAEAIEQRAALWNDGRTGTELAEAYLGIDGIGHVAEVERYEQSAGSPAYLAVSARGVASVPAPPETAIEAIKARDDRITTAEMSVRFGAQLGPIELPDEDGPDERAPGRHARRRVAVVT